MDGAHISGAASKSFSTRARTFCTREGPRMTCSSSPEVCSPKTPSTDASSLRRSSSRFFNSTRSRVMQFVRLRTFAFGPIARAISIASVSTSIASSIPTCLLTIKEAAHHGAAGLFACQSIPAHYFQIYVNYYGHAYPAQTPRHSGGHALSRNIYDGTLAPQRVGKASAGCFQHSLPFCGAASLAADENGKFGRAVGLF